MASEGEDREMETMSDSRKRPYADGHEYHSANKRSNRGPGEGVLLKQLIPSIIAGVIIGKGGEAITKLQSETDTTIKMSKSQDFYPGTTDRVCLITGSPENVKRAHCDIWERIRERCDRASDEYRIRLVVPNATVGMIIGKGGNYVRQIKEETGANVQISQKSQDSLLIERVVTINGTTDQSAVAFEMVFKMIAEDPQSGSCPNLCYNDFRGPVANANPIGSPFAHSNMMDMSVSTGGGKGMNHLSTDALKAALRGSGYSVQASDEIAAAMVTLSSYGVLGGSGISGVINSSASGLSIDYLATFLTNRNPGGRGDVGMYGGSSYGGSSFHQDRHELGGSRGFQEDSYGKFGGNSSSVNSFGLGHGIRGSNNSEMEVKESVTKELQVNENVVGAIIGPGGRAIVEIQKSTSAIVQISKKGVFAPGTRNRVVTITGAAGAVERAAFMVQQCIQQEESKRTRQEQMAAY